MDKQEIIKELEKVIEGAFIYCSKDNMPYKLIGVITEDGLNIFLKLIRDCFVFEGVKYEFRETYDVTVSLIEKRETAFKNLNFKLEFKTIDFCDMGKINTNIFLGNKTIQELVPTNIFLGNKTIQELVPLIHQWAKERGIFDNLTPFHQLLKTHEEVGELIKACYDDDLPAIQDAIGDVMVTLINYCYFRNENFNNVFLYGLSLQPIIEDTCLKQSFSVNSTLIDLFKFECNKTKYNNDLDFVYAAMIYFVKHLNGFTKLLKGTTLEACLNIAYNEIKDRKGKIINGKFIKDE